MNSVYGTLKTDVSTPTKSLGDSFEKACVDMTLSRI